MKALLAITATALVLTGLSIVSSFACDQDILCPEGWMWSDSEGSCTEAPRPTT